MKLDYCKGENALSFRIIKNCLENWTLHHWRFFTKSLEKNLLRKSVAVFFISNWGCGWNGVTHAGLAELIIFPGQKYGESVKISSVNRRI